MKLTLNRLKLKQEIDRAEVLNWGIMFFVLLGQYYEATISGEWFSFILRMAVIFVYFFLVSRLLKNLYYSFWTFLGLLGIYLVGKTLGQPFFSMSFTAYLASLILLSIQAYSLWTPIFYPIVSWWEYDFRYRDDLKVKVGMSEPEKEGRLTDLRKGAGCVVAFEDYKLGDTIWVEPFDEMTSMRFKAEIMSKRKYSLGRPFTYGVRFLLEENGDDTLFKNFVKFWKSERKIKQNRKFQND